MDWLTVRLRRTLLLEGLDAPENRAIVRVGLILAAAAMILRLLFWLYTGRCWEDALITCLHSENFALGLGLTHVRPGEPPLQGFSSPLGLLVPLMADLVRVGSGLGFIKLVSVPAAALTVVYILAIGIHPAVRLAPPLIGLVMGFVAFEHHQILFGMSGMETQLAVLVLVMSFYYVIAWKPAALGVSLGLCMLARPDFAFWAVIVGVYGLFHDRKGLIKTVIPVSLALYLPWIAFTILYYGSPIPHTIIAKGLGYVKWHEAPGALTPAGILGHTWKILSEQILVMLGPTFCGHGCNIHPFFAVGAQSPAGLLMAAFSFLGMGLVLLRRRWETWPLAAFALVYTFYYVYLVPIVFTWYKMPHVAAILLLASLGVQAVTNRLHDPVRWRIRTGFSLAYVSLFAGVLPWTFLTERQIQRDIEEPVRKAAGLYLRDRMKPDEAVGGEPLGYMGYYSRGNVYDWPGLNSRRVVEWSRENPGRRSLQQMLEGLQPEYLFLRDMEMLYVFQLPAWIRNNYHPVAAFQVDREKARRIRWLETSMDVEYRIYKKNRPDDPKPYDESLWPAAPPVNFLEADKIYAVGASYTHRGMLRQAIAHYERAVELEPGHTNAWHDLAVVYLRDGQHARARAAAEESIRRGAKPDPVLMDALK